MAFKVLGINWGSPKGTNRKCLEWAMLGAEEAGCAGREEREQPVCEKADPEEIYERRF